MGGCSVYVTTNYIFVFTVHESNFGFGVVDEPFFKIASDASPMEIGNAIFRALSSAQTGVETTGRLKSLTEKMLEFAGYRSMRKFEEKSIAVEILSEATHVKLIPTKPADKGGFLHEPDKALICALDAREIGETFSKLLSKDYKPR